MKIFDGVTLYDWVPYFKGICNAIEVIGQDENNRNEILKNKAKNIFGANHAIVQFDEIDPLSFIYTLAQWNTTNRKDETFSIAVEEFGLVMDIPTDWIFPTPTANTKALFYEKGDYSNNSGNKVGVAPLWNLFADAYNGTSLNAEDFASVLSIRNVGVAKLTQTLFLINPRVYLPVDDKTLLLLNNGRDVVKNIETTGLYAYRKVLEEMFELFPECNGYEINLFCSLVSDSKNRLIISRNYCQVSSWVDGQREKDYFDDFVEDNAVWAGGSGEHKSKGGLYPVDQVHDGDIVLVRRGTKNMGGIGVIIDNEYLNGGYDDNKVIRIVWINKSNRKLGLGVGDMTGFNLATENTLDKFRSVYTDTFKLLDKFRPQNEQSNTLVNTTNPVMPSLNTILYGPPGTGKTYSTIEKAIKITNPNFQFPNDPHGDDGRKTIKDEYKRLTKEGKISFITFHQSLSYEDFIEGIKPKTLGDKVIYENEPGLFKAFCEKARFSSGNLNEIIERFKTDISEEDGKQPLKIKAAATSFDIIYRGTNVFYVQPDNTIKQNPWYPVNIDNIRKAFETDAYDGIYNSTYVREVINHLKKNYGLIKSNRQSGEIKENYVLIIDEINRGNVSQIFGELITLIEPDKREGCKEELSIVLPYSKKPFSVPDNVYLIGTMNTADRSVEALDTALRRRFVFEHMQPSYDGLNADCEGINLSLLLSKLNERLRVLKDNDHVIGHAWFWNINSLAQLQSTFAQKIMPLMQEYFYNDFEKLGLVLGDRFFESMEKVKANAFASSKYGSSLAQQYTSQRQYILKPCEQLAKEDFLSIYELPVNNRQDDDDE